MSEQIVKAAKVLCVKFIGKVESGRARSVETYAECQALLEMIEEYEANQQQGDRDMNQSFVNKIVNKNRFPH